MMNHIMWKDEYNIGVDRIDKEHQRLLRSLTSFLRWRRKREIIPEFAKKESSF